MSLLLPSLLLFGCEPDQGLHQIPERADGFIGDCAPTYEVTPASVSFGALKAGERATEVLTVINTGECDLQVVDLHLEDPLAPFEIGPIGSVLVPPGQTTDFTVSFVPQTASAVASHVVLETDARDQPWTEVPVSGQGIAPRIELRPADFDFGTHHVGCTAAQPIEVRNSGNALLVVDAIQYTTAGSDLMLLDGTEIEPLPWEIPPGDDRTLWVDYSPLDTYADAGYLSVASNDPAAPLAQAMQLGSGALYGENLDLFEQPLKGSTDILFAVDWSGSMYDDVANVRANFQTFIETLGSLDSDYHIAVVTEDDGCINGYQPYIDNTLSMGAQLDLFDTMLCEQPNGQYCSSYGSNTERAFMLLESALSATNIGSGGCNEDFYREDATLALIGVSDEPEQSVNPYTYYVSLFQSLKTDRDDLVMHAIGGDYPQGCGSAAAYTGFYEATVATDGLFLSICASDFGAHLQALAEGSTADLSSFELSDVPVEETLGVTVDGIQIPSNTTTWSYNAVNNSIDFAEDSVPQGGAIIEVAYALYGDCDQ